MPIYKEGKEIVAVSKGSRGIDYIFKGAQLLWRAIRSCFGNGYWVNKMQWSNEEGWRNNKRI